MIVDQGTDKELNLSVDLPKNTEVVWFYDGTSVDFDDPEYTSLEYWDRMSDRTIYIVREPDDETLERHQKLYDELVEKLNLEQAEEE